MAWTREDENELFNTAYAAILLFVGGGSLEVAKDLFSPLMIFLLILGNVLFGFGIYLGYLTIKKIRDRQKELNKKITDLEDFFGIIPERFGFSDIKVDRNEINKQRRSSGSSYLLIIFTGFLVLLTVVLIFQTWVQYSIENFDFQNPLTRLRLPLINNTDYNDSKPIWANLEISSLGPHYYKFNITSVSFLPSSFPPCMYNSYPSIRLTPIFEKYIDRGAVNEKFEFPLYLNYHPKFIPPQNRTSERLLGVPIQVSMGMYDYQSFLGLKPIAYETTRTFDMNLTGVYYPKVCGPTRY